MQSLVAANIACLGLAFIYVAGFYIFLDPSLKQLSRNHPLVIRGRIKAVTLASLISPVVVWLFASQEMSWLECLGLAHPLTAVGPLLLTALLFLGPIVQAYFDSWQSFLDTQESLTSLIGLRNYVVAPATEEFVFRSCIIAILNSAGTSRASLVFASPLYFGLAHLHHMRENYYNMGATAKAFKTALFVSLFQFTYTTVFGWYASFLFLRTGSVWPPIICHAFCNLMGFPHVSDIKTSPPRERTVIVAAYLAGIVLFYNLLFPLTSSGWVGKSLYWKM